MKSVELREKLHKAEENVAKIEKTIARHKIQAEKKLAVLTSKGWEPNRNLYNDGKHYEEYWAVCEYEDKLSDIRNSEKKLAEAQKVVANWQAKLDRQLEHEKTIQTEIPEVFRTAKDELVDSWTIWDIAERDTMIKKKQEYREKYPNYCEFNDAWRRLYTYSREESLRKSDEEIRKQNEKAAESWLLDLYNRVYAITGEITDCSGIRWGGKCLDGTVVGKAGTAIVTTIEAGGYNIVRWHLRVLVKEA